MGAALLGNTHHFDSNSGVWVNERFQRIAEIINDWDSHLSLLYIPERDRTEADVYPYAVAYTNNEFAPPHIILHVTEAELNENLLARLFDMRDNAQDIHTKLANLEAARALVEAKEQEDHQAELHELAYAMWHTTKHTYRVGDKKFEL